MNLRCFLMMQFEGAHQDVLFRKIQEAINRFNRTEGYSIALTRADLTSTFSTFSLEKHLKNYIDNSDFTIADISQLNPNVFF